MSTISLLGAIPTALAGLNRASNQAAGAAANIATGDVEPQDIVDLKLSSIAFRANAAVIRTADETEKQLLDIIA